MPKLEDFEPYVGSVFVVTAGETEVPLTLDGIKDQVNLAASDPEGRPIGNPNPFSLSFSGPKELLMEQSLYLITHPEMGKLHLFVKPYHEAEDAFFYEIVFN